MSLFFSTYELNKMASAISTEKTGNYPRAEKTCTYCQSHHVECIPPGPTAIKLLSILPLKKVAKSGCIRQQVTLTLLFASFPFCGICITDLTFALMGPGYYIPTTHLVVCFFLSLIIIYSFIKLLIHPQPNRL